MADTKKLDSTIQIDGEPYEIIAKTAEKVAAPLTIKVVNGDIKEYTYDGSSNTEIEINAVKEAAHLTNSLTITTTSNTNDDIEFNGSEPKTIDLKPYALKAVKITASDGLTGNGTLGSDVTISHAVPTNASEGAKGSAADRTYIKTVTTDKFGHVTGITTGTETVTDTNTATAADNILDGSNSGTEITYKPYASQQSKLSFDTSSTNPTKTDRLNLNGYLYATKLYSGATEVLTKNTAITGATKCKITYDTNGLVTAGADLAASDIPNLAASKITAMTGYSMPSATGAIATTDTLNSAIGKLEKALDGKLSSTKITVSQNEPTGGATGDIWFKY